MRTVLKTFESKKNFNPIYRSIQKIFLEIYLKIPTAIRPSIITTVSEDVFKYLIEIFILKTYEQSIFI